MPFEVGFAVGLIGVPIAAGWLLLGLAAWSWVGLQVKGYEEGKALREKDTQIRLQALEQLRNMKETLVNRPKDLTSQMAADQIRRNIPIQ